MKHGWDQRQYPHYWREDEKGMLNTLCGERSRPGREDFELRGSMTTIKRCKECARIREVMFDEAMKIVGGI